MNVAATFRKKTDSARESVADQTDHIKDAAMDEISSLIALLNEKIKAVGIDAEVLTDSAREKAVSLEKSIAAELTERPLRSLALAALAGLALGILTRK